ncbi:hypothetical protein [Burkholderia gladioli]|uniref:hypothetical protein n=1 Tax=Burkholderia gladioli TaxID=28095 RepID=UPI00163EF67E|nr:hypothetical protein [Burkholderia gladioli]
MNCKPGDLAIIIKTRSGEAIGWIVRVLEIGREIPDLGYAWCIKTSKPVYVESIASGKHSYTDEPLCPDSWLRPISGIPMTDDVTDEVVA